MSDRRPTKLIAKNINTGIMVYTDETSRVVAMKTILILALGILAIACALTYLGCWILEDIGL